MANETTHADIDGQVIGMRYPEPEHLRRYKMVVRKYADGNPMMTLFNVDNPRMNFQITTNIEGFTPTGPCCFLIKDWSENQGILDALIDTGKFEKTGVSVKSGFIEAHEVRYTG